MGTIGINVDGVDYVRADACCDGCGCDDYCGDAAPEFVDADGTEVKVGTEVRVRLSKLEVNHVDRDNRHGTVVAATKVTYGGEGWFTIQFSHRQKSGSYKGSFYSSNIRVD